MLANHQIFLKQSLLYGVPADFFRAGAGSPNSETFFSFRGHAIFHSRCGFMNVCKIYGAEAAKQMSSRSSDSTKQKKEAKWCLGWLGWLGWIAWLCWLAWLAWLAGLAVLAGMAGLAVLASMAGLAGLTGLPGLKPLFGVLCQDDFQGHTHAKAEPHVCRFR